MEDDLNKNKRRPCKKNSVKMEDLQKNKMEDDLKKRGRWPKKNEMENNLKKMEEKLKKNERRQQVQF